MQVAGRDKMGIKWEDMKLQLSIAQQLFSDEADI